MDKLELSFSSDYVKQKYMYFVKAGLTFYTVRNKNTGNVVCCSTDVNETDKQCVSFNFLSQDFIVEQLRH